MRDYAPAPPPLWHFFPQNKAHSRNKTTFKMPLGKEIAFEKRIRIQPAAAEGGGREKKVVLHTVEALEQVPLTLAAEIMEWIPQTCLT